LEDVQLSFEEAPFATVLGLALKVTVGAEPTDTVADSTVLPPAPEQVIVKVALFRRSVAVREPLVAQSPVQLPEALHDVAPVDDHVTVELAPGLTVVGLTLMCTTGAAA